MLRRLVAIVGPTASGKSAVAFELARRLGGEIVNADSRQIYRQMDIGTAKPSSEKRRVVRHHLFDICEPGERYSLALFRRDARKTFEAIWARGSFPWIVGGSGQYVWSLLEDRSVPEVAPNPELRARLSAFADDQGTAALHARLQDVDPVAAERIDERNVRRVVRALEVHEATGRPISEWQQRGEPDFEYLIFGLEAERDELDKRIGRRTREMFEAGFVDEVRGLLDAGVGEDAPAMSSIGYAEVVRYLRGEVELEETIEATAKATRRLARRQLQWFRPSDERIRWLRTVEDIELEANIFTGACTNALRGSSSW
ncbi:MAG TPA: tRNA (adenosine(37)-N6)-dimethylallyltransferase MiaA [Dehalococcoidia bacterium]|nr:tRNA (adenosine(37)-N6)-dimethylallyltransferase MiaA [Dehalococcoidia bacterium]